jgi:hypothetical protein
MQNDQVCLGQDLDNTRYPNVKPETLEAYSEEDICFLTDAAAQWGVLFEQKALTDFELKDLY